MHIKTIKKLLLILCVITASISYAQNRLPQCSGAYWNNCYGVREYPAQGDVYVGQWKNDAKNGQGTYTWSDGTKYFGQFKDDSSNGQGTQTWPDGRQYVGQWRDNQYNGEGTFTFSDGRQYVGQHKDHKRNGQGTFTWPDGEKYLGQFKDDIRNGFGTHYNANGSIKQQGLWRDDKFIQAQTPPIVTLPVVPKPPVNNAQDIKHQKCIRLGLVPGSPDFQQCIN
jgi:hypothetical protein